MDIALLTTALDMLLQALALLLIHQLDRLSGHCFVSHPLTRLLYSALRLLSLSHHSVCSATFESGIPTYTLTPIPSYDTTSLPITPPMLSRLKHHHLTLACAFSKTPRIAPNDSRHRSDGSTRIRHYHGLEI